MTKKLNFKEQVIQLLKQVPYGRVTTYGTIATLAGWPRGAWIVGGILHNFSDKADLPWQRIINRHGFISTNCEEHMRQLQKALLLQEGIAVSQDFMVDLDKYGWWGEESLDNSKLEIK